jgi:hypothetical protein
VVSKRLSSRYMSGPSRVWTKTKCPGWKRAHEHRHKLFEVARKPEPTEGEKALAKKRVELARCLNDCAIRDVRAGIARELRTHVEILEREIADLEASGKQPLTSKKSPEDGDPLG